MPFVSTVAVYLPVRWALLTTVPIFDAPPAPWKAQRCSFQPPSMKACASPRMEPNSL